MYFTIKILLFFLLLINSQANENSYHESVQKLLYINSNVIAIVTESESYGGGAHGYSRNYYENYDKNDNSLLSWEKVFKNNKKIFNFVYKKVKKTLVDKDYMESFNEVEQRKRLSLFKEIGNFSIQKEGLYIEFPLYSIAPYVYGHKSLLINKIILRKYLNKVSYLYYFH